MVHHGPDGNVRRFIQGIAKDSGRDSGKRDTVQSMFIREANRVSIAISEQVRFAGTAATPDRANSVDHILGFEKSRRSGDCLSGWNWAALFKDTAALCSDA